MILPLSSVLSKAFLERLKAYYLSLLRSDDGDDGDGDVRRQQPQPDERLANEPADLEAISARPLHIHNLVLSPISIDLTFNSPNYFMVIFIRRLCNWRVFHFMDDGDACHGCRGSMPLPCDSLPSLWSASAPPPPTFVKKCSVSHDFPSFFYEPKEL